MQTTATNVGTRFIAHRGNTDGCAPGAENTMAHLERALRAGFEVECDVVLRDGEFWLGHDRPDEPTSLAFLSRAGVWCHAKTVQTMQALLDAGTVHCFFQADDEVALTSRGYLWTHSRCSNVTPRSVMTIVGFDAARLDAVARAAAVCTDHPERWRQCLDGVQSPLLRFRDCALLVLDVDGVMTDGTKVYDKDGVAVGKRFHDHDFTAIGRFAQKGVKVCFLTADKNVTESVAKTRGIDFWYARKPDDSIDKPALLPVLERHYGVARERFAYVGDDCFDLPIMRALGVTFCPSVAPRAVQDVATHVLQRRGGDGLIAELYELHEAL